MQPEPITSSVAIVGAGFSGTLLAIHLLRHGCASVTLVERRGAFARGIAYSTRAPEHRLNVRASGMSAFPDELDHFANWWGEQGEGAGFAGRTCYGDYLVALLEEAEREWPDRLRRCPGEGVQAEAKAEGFRLTLAGGERIDADALVLALGNLPPQDPPGLSGCRRDPDRYVADPWAQDFTAGLDQGDEVAVIGTGLTMVDVVTHLATSGFGGRITALSRRGLVPRAHVASAAQPAGSSDDVIPSSLSALLHHVRQRANAIGWRDAVDQLRPLTQALWEDAPVEVRRRFLRHLRPWWDVHRHRLAPTVAAQLELLIGAGRLQVEAGRIVGCQAGADGLDLTWQPRGMQAPRQRRFRRIINCTGPQGDLSRTDEPLLRSLLDDGLVRTDALRLGLDVTRDGEALDREGRPNPRLFAVGPLSRGTFWEIIAVPDIRVQVRAVADRIARAIGADT